MRLYLNELSSHKVGAASQSVAMRKEPRHAHALQVLHTPICRHFLLGVMYGAITSCQAHRCYLA